MRTDYRRRFRHIQPIGATFFVTWNLEGAIPREILLQIKQRREEAIAQLRRENPPDLAKQIYLKQREAFIYYDSLLDKGNTGPRFLQNPTAARAVQEVMHGFDNEFYRLEGYTIMSNHVHALLDFSIQMERYQNDPDNYVQLEKVMMRIKGASSYYINKILGRSGKFWAEESWDRYIRDDKHRWAALEYIANNPVKAGLCTCWEEYPFSWIRKQYE